MDGISRDLCAFGVTATESYVLLPERYIKVMIEQFIVKW